MRQLVVLCICLLAVPVSADLDIHWRQNMATFWEQKATQLKEKGDIPASLACYDSALAYVPEDPHLWFDRGLVLRHWGQLEMALASYESTMVRDRRALAPRHNGAYILHELGRQSEALAWSDSSLERGPADADVWYLRGRIMSKTEQWADAIACYTMALTYGKTSVEALFYRATAFVILRDYDAAMGSFLMADHVDPGNANILAQMAATQLMAGKNEEAISYADSALARQTLPTTWYIRAAALANLGRNQEACLSLKTAFADRNDWALKPAATRLLKVLSEVQPNK